MSDQVRMINTVTTQLRQWGVKPEWITARYELDQNCLVGIGVNGKPVKTHKKVEDTKYHPDILIRCPKKYIAITCQREPRERYQTHDNRATMQNTNAAWDMEFRRNWGISDTHGIYHYIVATDTPNLKDEVLSGLGMVAMVNRFDEDQWAKLIKAIN